MDLWAGVQTYGSKNGGTKKARLRTLSLILLIMILFSLSVAGCMKKETSAPLNKSMDSLTVHFIDVGQADCILIETGEHAMLIDAGNNEDAGYVEDYLWQEGISELEYLVGTHPHEDHIGGLDVIIQDFDVFKVLMPKVNHDTQTYKDVLLSMVARMIQPIYPVPGSSYKLGGAEFTILSPGSKSYEELNDYSIVIKLEYGETSFLFTGDAGLIPEQEMIAGGYDLSADVLKVAHHGSSYSTSEDFLDKVNPTAAVISAGKNNDYQHPHAQTMQKLEARGIPVYRTDENGTILAVSDGKSIHFNKDPGSYTWPQEEKTDADRAEDEGDGDVSDQSDLPIVYITESGDKYHLGTCRFLDENKLAINKEEAVEKGYKPCLLCKP